MQENTLHNALTDVEAQLKLMKAAHDMAAVHKDTAASLREVLSLLKDVECALDPYVDIGGFSLEGGESPNWAMSLTSDVRHAAFRLAALTGRIENVLAKAGIR